VLILFLVQLGLYWIARFFSDRVEEALSPVRIFDRKIEDALVVESLGAEQDPLELRDTCSP
jgi:hypothetical protein